MIPRVRLVANHGEGPDATHVPVNDKFITRPSHPGEQHLRHPRLVRRAVVLDALYSHSARNLRSTSSNRKYRPYGQEIRKRLSTPS